MKKCFITSLALLLALSAANSVSWAVVKDFDGDTNFDFLTAANWNDGIGGDDDTLPGASDEAIIHDGFTGASAVTYSTPVTTTVGRLTVGGDWHYTAPTTGDFGTSGELVMTAGKILVTNKLEIARARGVAFGDGNGTGLITMTNSELELDNFDHGIGVRQQGELNIGLNAKVYNTPGQENYWRVGNYGVNTDAGLEGNGLLNVHDNGTFNAHVIFIADNDAVGEVRVSDTGSVVLTGNLVPRPSGFQAAGSAKVQMNGAGATLSAFNLESASEVGEIPTLYEFNADSLLGVSEIKLTDAINITNNALAVNLNGYPLANFSSVLLFDGDQALVGNRIFGTFASTTVTGSPFAHRVVYDQVNGDILLQRIPEPTTMLMVGVGLVIAVGTKRRSAC
jgi:hypothetical protein